MAQKKSAVKNPAAVALGSLGGKAKVPKGFSSMDENDRKELGRQGALKRWAKATVKKKSAKKAAKKK